MSSLAERAAAAALVRRGEQRRERAIGIALEQAQEARRVGLDEVPEIGRGFGNAGKDCASAGNSPTRLVSVLPAALALRLQPATTETATRHRRSRQRRQLRRANRRINAASSRFCFGRFLTGGRRHP